MPGPSLKAASEPPHSLAARAPLCRPKPWPCRRVVKPWAKILVRFSGAMPTPLSMTEIATSLPSDVVRRIRDLSARPDSSQANFALRMRFTRIWRTLFLSTATGSRAW